MSDPRRLRDEHGTAEARLLRAWQDDRPSKSARDRALAAVLVGSVAPPALPVDGGASGAAASGAGGATKAAAGAAKVAAGGAGAFATTKAALGVGAVVLAVTAGAALAPTSPPSPPRSPVSRSGVAPSPVAPSPVAATGEPRGASAPPASDAPALPDGPRASASGVARSVAPERREPPASQDTPRTEVRRAAEPDARGGGLALEVRGIDAARAALERGAPAAALAELDAFTARHPRAVLVQEAEVVRVEALVALDRRPEAAARARALLAQHPSTPHRAKLDALLASEAR